MKKLLIIFLLFVSYSLFSQQFNKSAVKWLTIQEAIKLQETNPKTIMIDMYTSWCGWCKKMDAETFTNPSIAEYINTNFYPVKFDAEGFDTVEYKGEKYFNPSPLGTKRSPNKFAVKMLNSRLSYPTIVYIDYEWNPVTVPGFMSVKDIEPILIYFAERVNKQADYQLFYSDFKDTFYADSTTITTAKINWIDIKDCIELMKTNPKKIFLFVASEYSNVSKIMLSSTIRHPVIADYINNNYYPVKINYDMKDTLTFSDGAVFTNEGKVKGYPHKFVLALLQPELRFPAVVFFDEDFKLLNIQRAYVPTIVLEKILDYFGADHYKNQVDWIKFNENYKSKLNNY